MAQLKKLHGLVDKLHGSVDILHGLVDKLHGSVDKLHGSRDTLFKTNLTCKPINRFPAFTRTGLIPYHLIFFKRVFPPSPPHPILSDSAPLCLSFVQWNCVNKT